MIRKGVLATLAALALITAPKAEANYSSTVSEESSTVLEEGVQEEWHEGVIPHSIYGHHPWFRRYFCPYSDLFLPEGVEKHEVLKEYNYKKAVEHLTANLIGMSIDEFLNDIGKIHYKYSSLGGDLLTNFRTMHISGKLVPKHKRKYYPCELVIRFERDEHGYLKEPVFDAIPLSLEAKSILENGLKKLFIKFFGGYDIDEIRQRRLAESVPLGGVEIENPECIARDHKIMCVYVAELIKQAEKKAEEQVLK